MPPFLCYLGIEDLKFIVFGVLNHSAKKCRGVENSEFPAWKGAPVMSATCVTYHRLRWRRLFQMHLRPRMRTTLTQKGDAPNRKHAHTPPARSSHTKRVSPPSTIRRSRVKALLPLVPALSRPAFALEASALPPDIKTPPSASTAPAASGVTAWFVLEDGQVFDDATEAEAFMKLKGVSKIKIVPSLDDARAWYLGRAALL
ncbi:hypothetical protein FB451DRAFT_1177188 [Mycena latifolia]|nr:hypothetical protein FB451DRAFT_1177188 [Mycena latifolia]